jgi:hypothetical protein
MADQRYVGEHEIEDPEHLPTLTSVPPKDAVKTTLDESLYGSDELWNQQLFTGGSLASVLDLACTKPTDIKVPLWWGPLISSKEVQGKKGDEKKKQLRRAVFKVIRQKSQLLFMLAKSAERDLTEIMQSIETRSKGKLIGLEYKLKYLTSVQRKLIFECVGNPQKSVSEVMNTRMTDTLRYTIQYPTNQYCKCAKLMVDTLVDEKGYKSFEIRNYWETGHAYDGLNCSFQTDDYEAGGILFEVQVHTLESFRVKQYESHVLYELWRGVDHPQRKYMIFTQMVDLFDSVPRPPGDLMSIGVLNRKTCPEPPGYKAWIKDNKHELQRLKDKKYDTFGVSVDHVSAPEEMTTVVVDSESPRQAGTVIGNPMNSDGLGGDAGETGCLAKFWQSVSGCCSQKPSDQSETLMVSQMRDDPAKHVNPMFESTGAPRQDRFAFIRHGEAEHNVLFRAGKIEEGIQILDPPLTAKGRRQSEALCKYIEAERMSFDYAVVSCLSRALETCEIVSWMISRTFDRKADLP